jgi:hypothetical protein
LCTFRAFLALRTFRAFLAQRRRRQPKRHERRGGYRSYFAQPFGGPPRPTSRHQFERTLVVWIRQFCSQIAAGSFTSEAFDDQTHVTAPSQITAAPAALTTSLKPVHLI